MAPWMPAWAQKRLLRYALSHVGLLDTDALDLDTLGIHIGSSSTVELKNVALRLDKLAALIQLPPNVRITAARVLLLRLTVPANFFQQSIVALVDGIEVRVVVDQPTKPTDTAEPSQTPQHRKTARRIRPSSISTRDPTARPDSLGVLSTQQLAQSFLQDEPPEEKQELEARYMATSVSSDTSDESAVGTGTGLGLPAALAGFLQAIIDRVQVSIKHIDFQVSFQDESAEQPPRMVAVHVADIDVNAVTVEAPETVAGRQVVAGKHRHISVQGLSFHLLCEERMNQEKENVESVYVSQPSEEPKPEQRQSPEEPQSEQRESPEEIQPEQTSPLDTHFQDGTPLEESRVLPHMQFTHTSRGDTPDPMAQSTASLMAESTSSFDIRPGEDNVSWSSRRSHGSSDHDQLWSSFAPEVQPSTSDVLQDMSSSMFLSTIETQRISPEPLQSSESHSLQSAQDGSEQLQPDIRFGSTRESGHLPKRPSHSSSPQSETSDQDDLTESIVYSPAQAESMYMSAVGHEPRSPTLAGLPGQWGSSVYENEEMDQPFLSQHLNEQPGYESDDRAPTPKLSGRSHTSMLVDDTDTPDTALNYVSKEILALPRLELWINESPSTPEDMQTPHRADVQSSMMASDFHQQAPGAFSIYAEGRSSLRFQQPTIPQANPASIDIPETDNPMKVSIKVNIAPVDLQLDVVTLRHLYAMTKNLVPDSDSMGTKRQTETIPSDTTLPKMDISSEAINVRLLQDLPESLVTSSDINQWRPSLSVRSALSPLLRLEVQRLELLTANKSSLDATLLIGDVVFTAGTCKVLSFVTPPSSRPHQKPSRSSVSITSRSEIIQGAHIRKLEIRALPILVNVDMVKFDDDFSTFGGLSGIVETSSSVLSSGAFSNKQESSPPPRKGVRFEGVPAPPDLTTKTQTKINGSFDGLSAKLTANSCCLEFDAYKIKVVSREKAIGTKIDTIVLRAPPPTALEECSDLDVLLSDVNIFYLYSPEGQDLERLLALLTPSNDKYENDDDILLDTLLNQRRKGSVLRLNVSSFKTNVVQWTFIPRLQSLSEELAKLSAVAKYLPEDDRPGLLLLANIKEANVQIPLNAVFGVLEISLKDVQAAQVGFPALCAVSLGTVHVARAGGSVIVQEIVPVTSSEHLPMLTFRMVGDEVEPVAKIRLFNTCVEYNVPTLLAALDTTSAPEVEQKVQDIAASIVEMATYSPTAPSSPVPPTSKSSDSFGKRLMIDVLLHECALGLEPSDQDGKALALLKNTKFSTSIPPGEPLEATLEIREAALYITNQRNANFSNVPKSPGQAHHSNTSLRVQSHLLGNGFVCVSSIRSAKVVVAVSEAASEELKCIDVELRNEFFLLETCADSTQTLIAILNGLSPPAPLSAEPKFRSEAGHEFMSLDDMVNSFSGAAFVKPGPVSSPLFDVDEDLPPPEEDDLLVDSEMTSDLYGPVEGNFDPEDDDFIGGGGELASDTVESLLEQDPFEMTSSPQLSDDALIRSLKRQLGNNGNNAATTLQPFYVSDQQLEKTYGGPKILGDSIVGRTRFPVQVRIRDVNIMWNLYDGYDWQQTRDTITHAVEEVELKLEERMSNRRRSGDFDEEAEEVIGDCLFNSIYIGVPSARDTADLRQQINQGIDVASETESYATSGLSRPTQASLSRQSRLRKKRLRLQRSRSHKLGFEVKGVSLDFLLHPPDSGEVQSSVDVRVTDFEIFDHVPTSTWRKFLTAYHDENNMREMMKPMFHIELLNVRPVPELAATEITIHVSVLPLRLHVDQDALEFMTRFFDFKDDTLKEPETTSDPPFIQRLEVNTVDLCLDYKPKKVDYGGLRSGRVSEFKNFVILDTAHIKLKHAIVYGLRGFDTLHDTLSDIWTPDVIQNQLRGVLAGLGPVRPFVTLGAGVRDVVAIPIREYRKDGRLVRSVQKGAFHFAKTTTSGLARLGAKVAIGTQTMLQGAEDMLSPINASPSGRLRGLSNPTTSDVEDEYEESHQRSVSNYADQPLGVLQGLRSARRYLERDLLTAKDAFIAVQGELMVSGSAAGAAQAVARHAPTIMLRPVIGASRAVGQTLMGVGNQVDRANMKKMEDKYKRR